MTEEKDAENVTVTQPPKSRRPIKRWVAVGVVALVAIWVFSAVIGRSDKNRNRPASVPIPNIALENRSPQLPERVAVSESSPDMQSPQAEATADEAPLNAGEPPANVKATPTETGSAQTPAMTAKTGAKAIPSATSTPGQAVKAEAAEAPQPKGVAFITAAIKPLDYELNHRFWGWRPNDILDFTDNVNNFQLGVLEVTRRTAVSLAERISRTGSTAAFDPSLQNAMNWFMVRADRYWFPSPESKYNDGLKELRMYRDRLKHGTATFFTRNDNLIPLLMAYEDLLGSCDENLVKEKEDDGTPVSFFKADDYFYYAQGVASAMDTILRAVLIDFHDTLQARHGVDVLENAIEDCHRATEIHPLIVTNSDLGGILANHRANMAAPISHARFYLGVLIKTLST